MSNLDQEMWDWKYEPVSPAGTPPLDIDDDWFLLNKSVESPKNAAEPVMYDDNPSRAQVARKLLDQLDEWIKEGNCLFLFFVNFICINIQIQWYISNKQKQRKSSYIIKF